MKNFINKIMNNKSLRYKITLVITLVGLLTIVSGGSYALLTGNVTSSNEQVIKAGKVKLLLTESFDDISDNVSVMSDVDGLLLDDTYDFTIKNIGDCSAKIDVNLTNNAPSGFTGDLISSEYIQVGLKINGEEMGPMNLQDVENIIDSNIINENEIINYKLRVWVDESIEGVIDDLDAPKMFLKLELDAEQRVKDKTMKNLDKSGANEPVLSENMIPVYYDDDAEVWKKADSTNLNSNYQWYDYDNKMWANSVTVSSTNRDTYKASDPGTPIPMSDILTMQVWIPRYKYKVWNYNLDGTVASSPQEIDITFEKGTAKTGEITCEDQISGTDGAVSEICQYNGANCTDATCNGKTYTHPAFTFGDKEVKGIWIGKFESSSDIECTGTNYDPVGTGCNIDTIKPLVKPDIQSWRYAMVSVFENNTMAMNDANNIYGFTSADDTHMMKNIEWGAVAYLSHSKYGVNREVYTNNSSDLYTGRSGGNVGGSTPINGTYTGESSTTQYNAYGYYTYDGYLLEYNTNTKSEAKDMSKVGSTTGNIYGIYDMSGGSYEYVMGNIVSIDGTTMMSGYNTSNNHSGYTGILYDDGNYTSYTGTYSYPDNKYLDRYSFGTSSSSRQRSKLGDGIKEVYNTGSYGWNSDYNSLAYNYYPWFKRGGHYSNGALAGLFFSYNDFGYADSGNASRFSITP